MRNEPVIIIDDDLEDLELLREMITEMQFSNQIILFSNSLTALEFLKTSALVPLFILCDINMPKLNGFQLREELLNSNSKIKNAPFLFLSTSKMEREISIANELKVHAYFAKSNTLQGMKETLENILSLLKINSKI
jgi:CheY-like chemotaxis protein